MNTTNADRAREAADRLNKALESDTLAEAKAAYGATTASFWRTVRKAGLTDAVKARWADEIKSHHAATQASNRAIGQAAHVAKAAEKEANMVEDATFLARHGEHPANAAKRLGYKNTGALERALERANRPDIMARLWANDRMNSKGDSA